MKCKNIECENETIGKRVYCSLTCRNVFVNKYLRNYDKVSDTFKQKKKENEIEYLKEPKLCKNCSNVIPYDFRDNIFCNHSCAATITNSNRDCTWGDKISESLQRFVELNPKFPQKRQRINRLYKLTCQCGNIFDSKRKEIKFCSKDCRKKYRINNSKGDDYQRYRTDCKF